MEKLWMTVCKSLLIDELNLLMSITLFSQLQHSNTISSRPCSCQQAHDNMLHQQRHGSSCILLVAFRTVSK